MAGCGDSYCGIYCGACSILNHGETGRGDEFIACCDSVPEKELACGGCKSDALLIPLSSRVTSGDPSGFRLDTSPWIVGALRLSL
jgi:hypothetical protein